MKIRTNNKSSGDMVFNVLVKNEISVTRTSSTIMQVESIESDVRILLQKELDSKHFDYSNNIVSVNGNALWSLSLIVMSIRETKKSGVVPWYLYNFLVVHCNAKSKPKNLSEVVDLLNEVDIPKWKGDALKILKKIKSIKSIK